MHGAPRKPQGWSGKFAAALAGCKHGIRGQSSFFVHFFVMALVVVAGVIMRVKFLEWCLLVFCIQSVLVAEMFNSALEWLAKGITQEHSEPIGISLDIASGAVLLAAVGASCLGVMIFVHRLGVLLTWWPSLF